jgi:flagellin
MGLRINTNVPSVRALRNLRINDSKLSGSLERLSTGLRINRASDDPAGLIISEQLRAQVSALKQAVENSQNASNMITTADAALQEVQNLLIGLKDSVVFAQNSGGSSPEQIAAEQDAVDNTIAAIDRIGTTTRFSDRALLNGTAAFTTASSAPAQIDNLSIRSVTFASGQETRDFDIDVEVQAERAEVTFAGASAVGATVLRLSGTLGTEDVNLASGATGQNITDAINAVAGFTGVYAELSGADVVIRSGEFGESELIQIETISGDVTGFGAAGTKTSDRGVNAEVSFSGQRYVGVGNNFSILNRMANLEFSLQSGTAPAAGTLTLSVRNTGLTFQLREAPRITDRINVGIDAVSGATLGMDTFIDRLQSASAGTNVTVGGFLNTLVTGGANDLFSNPENASLIVDRAIEQVGLLRGFLGAVQGQNLEPNINSVNVEIENLSASLSDLRDLDFAQETAAFTKSQILFQSSTLVLAQANAIPQAVLGLLQG